MTTNLINLPGGQFFMSSHDGGKAVKVNLRPFAISRYEVTQGLWTWVMGGNPSHFSACGEDCPVEMVSFDEVQDFIRKLNKKTDRHFRLPTEAEWEYACLAGRDTGYCGGDDADTVAWHNKNSDYKTHSFGSKVANGVGLYDMSGNVWEWTCSEYTKQSYRSGTESKCPDAAAVRVVRGGSWGSYLGWLHSTSRLNFATSRRFSLLGFRLVHD